MAHADNANCNQTGPFVPAYMGVDRLIGGNDSDSLEINELQWEQARAQPFGVQAQVCRSVRSRLRSQYSRATQHRYNQFGVDDGLSLGVARSYGRKKGVLATAVSGTTAGGGARVPPHLVPAADLLAAFEADSVVGFQVGSSPDQEQQQNTEEVDKHSAENVEPPMRFYCHVCDHTFSPDIAFQDLLVIPPFSAQVIDFLYNIAKHCGHWEHKQRLYEAFPDCRRVIDDKGARGSRLDLGAGAELVYLNGIPTLTSAAPGGHGLYEYTGLPKTRQTRRRGSGRQHDDGGGARDTLRSKRRDKRASYATDGSTTDDESRSGVGSATTRDILYPSVLYHPTSWLSSGTYFVRSGKSFRYGGLNCVTGHVGGWIPLRRLPIRTPAEWLARLKKRRVVAIDARIRRMAAAATLEESIAQQSDDNCKRAEQGYENIDPAADSATVTRKRTRSETLRASVAITNFEAYGLANLTRCEFRRHAAHSIDSNEQIQLLRQHQEEVSRFCLHHISQQQKQETELNLSTTPKRRRGRPAHRLNAALSAGINRKIGQQKQMAVFKAMTRHYAIQPQYYQECERYTPVNSKSVAFSARSQQFHLRRTHQHVQNEGIKEELVDAGETKEPMYYWNPTMALYPWEVHDGRDENKGGYRGDWRVLLEEDTRCEITSTSQQQQQDIKVEHNEESMFGDDGSSEQAQPLTLEEQIIAARRQREQQARSILAIEGFDPNYDDDEQMEAEGCGKGDIDKKRKYSSCRIGDDGRVLDPPVVLPQPMPGYSASRGLIRTASLRTRLVPEQYIDDFINHRLFGPEQREDQALAIMRQHRARPLESQGNIVRGERFQNIDEGDEISSDIERQSAFDDEPLFNLDKAELMRRRRLMRFDGSKVRRGRPPRDRTKVEGVASVLPHQQLTQHDLLFDFLDSQVEQTQEAFMKSQQQQ